MISGMMLPHFEMEAPTNLADATGLLAEAGEEARLLAGGTDLLVKMKHGLLAPRLVVSLGRVEGLDRLQSRKTGFLSLGPLVTMSAMASNPALRDRWTALSEGAAVVGGPIIRNRATVGGNIANARPCADTVPPLMALGARLQLMGPDGERVVDLDGLITGPGEIGIARDEILTGIDLPIPEGLFGSCYLKITRRSAMEVTIVGCAASLELDSDGETVKRARVVLTSVAAIPLRVAEIEPILEGQPPTEAALAETAVKAREMARPIDDFRAPATYRSRMVEVTTRRALQAALERARGRAGQ